MCAEDVAASARVQVWQGRHWRGACLKVSVCMFVSESEVSLCMWVDAGMDQGKCASVYKRESVPVSVRAVRKGGCVRPSRVYD